MTFDERLTWLLIGMVIGGVLGYFAHALRDIRSTVHHLDDQSRHNEDGLVRKPLLLDIVLLAVVILVAYAAIQSQQATNALKKQSKENEIARCESGADSREVQRDTVDAVYNLAISVVERTPDAPPRTKQEIIQTNVYIQRVNDFRDRMYEKIVPSEQCEPYVEDDNVKPPTSPAPPVLR